MRRLLSASVFALVTMFGPAQAEPKAGGRLNLIVQPEPPGLMLGITTNGPTQLVSGSIYESLLKYDEKFNPLPSLATSWEISPDGLIYTFHLQRNVFFHDSRPMTSADVLFTITEFLMKTQPRHRNTMARVAETTAPDDYTIVFKMKEPYEPFIRSFGFAGAPVLPKHIYQGTDFVTNPANDTPIGTGPFRFVEWKKGSYIKLAKFDKYWMPRQPYLNEIYFHVIPDGASRAVAYETGRVDVLPGGAVENFDVPRLAKLPNTCMTEKGWEYSSPHAFMWLNIRSKPMDDVRFRQAVMFAMDREFAREVIWNGLGKVATGPIASRTPFYKKVEPLYPHDPAKAKALLKEMKYDGKPVRLLPLPYGETWQRWAEAVKQNLEEVGIAVQLVSTDVPGWNQRVAQWDYDLAFTWLSQNADPSIGVERNYLTSQISKGSPWNNVEGYSNPVVDKLFSEAAVAYPASKRQQLYDEVQAILQKDVPVAWLMELSYPTISKCNVKGLIATSNGVNDSLGGTWIDK